MDGFPELKGDQVNQTDYFSRHYQAYGLNVQAMCDPDLLFTYIAVASPAKINDSMHSHVFGTCKIGCKVYLLGALSPQTARMG